MTRCPGNPGQPLPRRYVTAAASNSTHDSRDVELMGTSLRRNYHDAVRLAAWEEILADLAEEPVIAQLHADTARFHHGSAHAYAKALQLLVGEVLNVTDDKQAAKAATREPDLASMRCQGRRYRAFEPHQP